MIIVEGSKTKTFDYREANTLSARVQLSACPGASTSLNYQWSVVKGPIGVTTALNAKTKNSRSLYIERDTLQPPGSPKGFTGKVSKCVRKGQ